MEHRELGASGTDAETFLLNKPGGKTLPAVDILKYCMGEVTPQNLSLFTYSVIPLVCITC